jgi:hypothetical protein
MNFGQGTIVKLFMEAQENKTSSMEAELAGVNDSMGYILWAHCFMQEQGYDMVALLLYQDHMSMILLKKQWEETASIAGVC